MEKAADQAQAPENTTPGATHHIDAFVAAVPERSTAVVATEDYRVRLPVFEGPLDLLLHLIRKEQLNIYDIPIARICQTYLDHLQLMCRPDVNVAGEFFVMAATLTLLKSQVLLPVDKQDENEDDPRLPLVAQLLEYEKFKRAAEALDEKPWLQRDLFGRPANSAQDLIPVESLLDAPIEAVDAYQLLVNLKIALDRTTRPPLQISVDSTSLKEKVGLAIELFGERPVIDFNALIPAVHRTMDIVVSFMAILELAKLKFVEIIQTETYGPIQVRNVRPLNELNYALLDQY